MHRARTHLEVRGSLRHGEPIAVEYLDGHGSHLNHGFRKSSFRLYTQVARGFNRCLQMATEQGRFLPDS